MASDENPLSDDRLNLKKPGPLVHLRAENLLDIFTLLSVNVPDAIIQVTEGESLPQSQAASEAPSALADIGGI